MHHFFKNLTVKMHTSANREKYTHTHTHTHTYTHTHTNFDSKRNQRSLYLYDYCDRNLKKVFLCFLAASGVTGEPPAKRRVDVSGELAKATRAEGQGDCAEGEGDGVKRAAAQT